MALTPDELALVRRLLRAVKPALVEDEGAVVERLLEEIFIDDVALVH